MNRSLPDPNYPAETEAGGSLAGFTVSREPAIFWGPSAEKCPLGLASTAAELIGRRRAWFLISPSWHRDDIDGVRGDLENVRAATARWPQHRHVFLAATRRALENYRAVGLPAIVCSSNVFVDETIFEPAPSEPKQFDAIYNAVFGSYKRHELCRDIAKLGLIYHRYPYFLASEPDYVARIRTQLGHATFINEIDGPYRQFRLRELPIWLARARVGLCLSAHEGPMRACAEYLYCGLPVVTTPSIGGRDRMLNPAFSIETEPTPDAVAEAVAALIARRIDPVAVRAAALASVQPDRMRLVKLIAAIFREENVPFPEEADWLRLFRRGAWPFKTPETLMAEQPVAATRRKLESENRL
ncbi:MAG: glycosyltransferase family 4 protein [Dongiaceae bacterium]